MTKAPTPAPAATRPPAPTVVPIAPNDVDTARVRHLLAALSATNDAILRAHSAEELYQQVCDAAVLGGRFSSASVLLADADGRALQSVAVSGPNRNLGGTRISSRADSRYGRGLIGTTYRKRAPTVSDDLLTDPNMAPWRVQIETSGVRSGAGVPLLSEGRCIGVMLLYSRETGVFDPETVGLLQRMADNIIFCLRNLEREEQRLAHAEELLRFRTAMDTTGDAIYLIDPATQRYVDCNQTACRQTGYSRAELLSMHTWEVVKVSAEELARCYAQVIESGDAGLVSVTNSRPKDGRERIVEVHRRALRSGEGWLIVSIARDVTERTRQERLLAMEHAVTRNLAQSGSTREVLGGALRDICDCAGWQSAGYFARQDAAGTTLLVAGWMHNPNNGNLTAERAAILARPIPPTSALAQVIQTGQPIWTANVLEPGGSPATHAEWYSAGPWTGEMARLGVPVHAEGRVIGVMAFTSDKIREPDERLLQSLRVIGDQIGQFLQRKGTERGLRESEARFRALTELSSDWYWEQDAEHRFKRIGGAGQGKTGDLTTFSGHATWDLPGLVEESADFARHRAALAAREEFRDFTFAIHDGHGRLRWLSLSGSPLYGANKAFIGYRGVSRDVTERKRALDRIEHLATHDVLTGLPNRAMFTEVLGRTLESARRQDDRVALLFIDLDRFKLINDTLGHDAGDLLLKEMAQRMKACLRTSDLVARFGGDEFVVLVRQVADRSEATAVARKILDVATQAITIQGQECRVSASVGICLYPADGSDEQTLMKAADTAMYAAKQEGRNNFQFYTHERTQQSLARLKLESSLRRAVENHEFFLHYQPKVEMASGTIVGAEALVRWRTPDMRLVSPADFIPLAEETGLILQIGVWVLREACAQNMVWRRQGLPPIGMAVNLSPRQFADEHLLAHLERALRESGMDADSLELEITEGMMVQQPQHAVELLQAIKATGVRLAIDDFGTGYSSLGQLKRFPIGALKIDRSFVRELGHDADDMALTSAIIAMAKSLRLQVVAEGVETPQQEAFLREQGCDQMQGFLFSRPVPPEEFVRVWRRSLEARASARPAAA